MLENGKLLVVGRDKAHDTVDVIRLDAHLVCVVFGGISVFLKAK